MVLFATGAQYCLQHVQLSKANCVVMQCMYYYDFMLYRYIYIYMNVSAHAGPSTAQLCTCQNMTAMSIV